ncbi:MAG: hypothetical protein AAF638_05605 [Pseudomonadota bacterium]
MRDCSNIKEYPSICDELDTRLQMVGAKTTASLSHAELLEVCAELRRVSRLNREIAQQIRAQCRAKTETSRQASISAPAS